jgi:hypothetical protein
MKSDEERINISGFNAAAGDNRDGARSISSRGDAGRI